MLHVVLNLSKVNKNDTHIHNLFSELIKVRARPL